MTNDTLLPFSSDEVQALRVALHQWGAKHIRSFPWRQTTDPYHILLAEILLHRTQVKQVVPVYEAFLARYPDLASLLQASQDNIYHMLGSLGLTWRSRLFYEMLQTIATRYHGNIPSRKEDLLSLPGVSDYIASAVRCFAWNEPEVLLDTNTVRITGRLLGWTVRDSSRRSTRFRHALASLLDHERPRMFNYALLDLAHLICLKRRQPLCAQCPLNTWCTFATQESTA